jgi:predicted TPR repeat methyltransferase
LRYEISLPSGASADSDQDQEWCEIVVAGRPRRIRFHDYHEIYSIPGLYEQLFYDLLECDSPRVVAELIRDARGRRVLELGAGNGMVGERLRELGAASIVGVDILEEARMAAERDRPGVYDDYLVVDLTDLPPDAGREFAARRFNALVTVAALGFGDIPPNAFAVAYNLVEPGGLVAFNIKEDFIADGDGSGFSRLISRALEDGSLAIIEQRRYKHRLSVAGQPLHYVAIVAEKRRDLPVE